MMSCSTSLGCSWHRALTALSTLAGNNVIRNMQIASMQGEKYDEITSFYLNILFDEGKKNSRFLCFVPVHLDN